VKSYFLRRLLLIPLTLLGVTLLVFSIMWNVPGGPMEEDLQKKMGGAGDKKGSSTRSREQSGTSLKPADLLELEEQYDRDKPMMRMYAEWLGILPRDVASGMKKVGAVFPKDANEVAIAMPGTEQQVTITLEGSGIKVTPPKEVDFSGWQVRLQTPEQQAERWKARVKDVPLKETPTPRAILIKPVYDGLLQGSLGMSKNYQEPVWNMILDRMPVSIFYGLITMFLVYGICLPLGIVKAIKHRTWIDNASSVVVFFGYAIPGYALGSLLVVFLGARLGLFPLGGFTGEAFPNLDTWGKIKDLANHAVMPLICYMVGAFAFLTQIMKNNLMDNLAADYVRTAVAKGVGFRQAVFRHAFRNSIIPVATTFGSNITMLVSGSILIEKVFDINGFGLLQFNSLLERDQYLVMGLVTVSAVLMLLGNVISDLCVALVDPRVSYN
jgi:microcin C transport system permease protein